MAKIIVNIISKDDLMPAYLFVKEKYEEGDGLMFISAKDTTEELALVSELLKVSSQDVVNIVLTKERDEFTYERIGRRLLPELRKDVKYCVNLAGGTRYLALAVQHLFESFDSEFFFIRECFISKSAFDYIRINFCCNLCITHLKKLKIGVGLRFLLCICIYYCKRSSAQCQ